jgi:NAD(P)-dependent dehydrogenase (short-subunit alcohol dehydrogenase family)
VLVNNAARDDRHQLKDVPPELWDDLITVNLPHQFFASQSVLPAMPDAGSRVIINLASITFLKGFADLPVSVTARGGVVGLARAPAREWGPMACGSTGSCWTMSLAWHSFWPATIPACARPRTS